MKNLFIFLIRLCHILCTIIPDFFLYFFIDFNSSRDNLRLEEEISKSIQICTRIVRKFKRSTYVDSSSIRTRFYKKFHINV